VVRVRTPRERVQALGDEALVRQHFDVESDLNELLALAELIEERVASWTQDATSVREQLLAERAQVVARGELLSGERISRPSAITSEAVQHARACWAHVRGALLGLALH